MAVDRIQCLDGYTLKWIAIITMLIDHTGAIVFPQYRILRCIGRISFPIFCFLLVEGFFHTRDVEKYLTRLGVFALVSEIPYDLAFRRNILDIEKQNVFFTLFIGLFLLYAMQKSCEYYIWIIEILLAMWFALFLRTDYNLKGIVLICIFYFVRDVWWGPMAGSVIWSFMWKRGIQNYAGVSGAILALYNGERGASMKYFFYLFYPAHLSLLYWISLGVRK